MINHIASISKVSEILVSFYDGKDDFVKLLDQVESFIQYLSSNSDVHRFLKNRAIPRELKKQVVKEFKGTLDDYLINSLYLLIDTSFIFYLDLFFSSLKNLLLKNLLIQNVYVYSGYSIDESRKKKIEKLWRDRFDDKTLNFIYGIDNSLKLGIKIQMGTYLEEFSVHSNFKNVKLKLDSILI